VEVLRLLAQGQSNRDIAAALFISAGTVKRHLTNVYAKLNTASRLGAVQRAVQLGILPNATSAAHGPHVSNAG
jgi:ATP/maltotriose-dependent transcriptional regulator MalT